MKQQVVYIISNEVQKEVDNLKKLCEKQGYLCKITYEESDFTKDDLQLVDLVIIFCPQVFHENLNQPKKDEHFARLYIIEKYDEEFEKNGLTIMTDYVYKFATEEELLFKIKRQLFLLDRWHELKDKNIRFEALLNNTPYMTWFKDVDSKYKIVNQHFKEHSGKKQEQIYGQDDYYVWDGQIGEKCREYDLKVMNERKAYVFDEVIPGKRGYREYNVHKAPVINEHDEIVGTLGIARDITELNNSDKKIQVLMDSIPFFVWMIDKDSKYIRVNKQLTEYYQLKPKDLIGKGVDILLNEERSAEIRQEDLMIIKNKKPIMYEQQEIINGKNFIFEVHKTPIISGSGEVMAIVGLAKDITELKKAQEKIKNQAYTDSLTGLANRRGLYTYLNQHAQSDNIHLLFIDLDDFKQVNDTCGHHFGDEVLKMIGKQLKSACSDGFIARMGGDEFIAVFIGKYSKGDLSNRAKRIIKYIKQSAAQSSYKYNVSASVGIVTCDFREADVNKMLIKGDMALYEAKEQGKNQFVFYTEGLENERLMRIFIERDLSSAIDSGEISLYYQPIYDCQERICGFESLFRWKNAMYQFVPLNIIIDVIEKKGLMIKIGRYLLEKAFTFAKEINKNRSSDEIIVVTVNLSATQIMKEDFIDQFKQLIIETGITPGMIGIEITETVLLENIEENKKKLKALKELGVTILLDDFGTGYSSLNYLVQLPLTVIKIDKSFIWGMEEREEYKKLTKLIIDAAHSLQMQVLGEGVETKEQLDTLKKMGVDYIQGYYYEKPLPEEKAIQLLKKRED